MSKPRRQAAPPAAPVRPHPCRPAAALLGALWLGAALIPASAAFVQPYADLRWLAAIAGLVGVLGLMAWERGEFGATSWGEIIRGRDPLALGALLIAAGLLLSSIGSPNPGLGLRIGAREAFLAASAFCLSRRAIRASEVRWLAGCLIAAAGIQGAIGLVQAFAGPGAARSAMHGTLEQSEALCDFLGMGTAAAAIAALTIKSRIARMIAIFVAAIGATTIFIAGGRGGALSALIAVALGFIVFPPTKGSGLKSPLGRVAFPVLATVVILVIGVGLLNRGGNTLPARLVQMFDLRSDPIRHRIGLTAITGHMIADRPLIGSGPGRFAAAFSEMQGRLAARENGKAFWKFNESLSQYSPNEAHCDPLQWWAEYGLLPGLGLLLMIAGALLKGAIQIRNHADFTRAALWSALAAWSVVMWFSYPVHDPIGALFFWSLIGLVSCPPAGEP